MDNTQKPLSGITVLELATFVAGPSCGRLLADLGAQVIKLEAPKGDSWRLTGKRYNPKRFSDQENPAFDIYNTGKRFLSLNLKTEAGMEAFHKLLAKSDVFLTNTRPAALERLGLSYEQLKEKYPTLVYAILLGYGEKGPEAGNPAFDSTAFWSKSGFLHDQAPVTKDYMPISPPYGVGDTITGYLLLAEICAALYRRKCTGLGDHVSSTLFHNGIFCFGSMNIPSQQPYGWNYPVTRVQHGMPGGLYRCADDEWIYVGVSSLPRPVPTLCQAIDRMDLLDNRELITENYAVADKEKLYPYFRDAFLQKPCQYWLDKAKELDFPLVRVNRYRNVLQDPQAVANGFVEQVAYPNGNVDPMPSSPIEMHSVGQLKTVPTGGIGADTRQILAELGYTDAQIAEMLADGAAI